MKRRGTVFLVGGLLIAVGVILILLSVLIGGANFAYLNYQKRSFEADGRFNRVQIVQNDSLFSVDISVVGTTGDEVVVEYYETDRHKMEARLEGRTLVFECFYEGSFLEDIINVYNEEILIQVPYEYFDNLTISSISSDITVTDITTNNLTINSTSGNVRLNSLDIANNIDVSLLSGNIDLNYIKANEAHLVNSTGDAFVKDSALSSLSVKTISGKTYVDGVDFASSININATSGSVTLYLMGKEEDFARNIKTISGSSNVSEVAFEDAEKKIDIDIVSGKIYIYFIS